MPNLANVAATLHHHLCTHDWHGYDQHARWGDGEGVCSVAVDGKTYAVEQGDRDCSSSVIECWRAALRGTPYEGKLNGATYTGNMRSVFVNSGLFEWKPMSFIAQRGDIYLNEANHTAMCQTPNPDVLSEFSIAENGTIYGKVGDQTGWESHVRAYYDYPWDGILHYNGKADTATSSTPSGSIDQMARDVLAGKYGNGDARKKALGSNYDAVQKRVNEILGGKAAASASKSVDELAREVIQGKWGNSPDRKAKLEAAGYDYAAVQKRVNEMVASRAN